jgi:hypothetical protein
VTANLSRVIYFHHRNRAPLGKLGEWFQTAWYYAYFNWWLHYNFSSQDGVVAAPCRYWTEENLSSTDSHLVMLRKLVTERSRDAQKKAAQAGHAAPLPTAEERFFREQQQRGEAIDKSLEEAASHTEYAPGLDFIVGSPRRRTPSTPTQN